MSFTFPNKAAMPSRTPAKFDDRGTSPWIPSLEEYHKPIEETIEQEVFRLRKRVRELEKKLSDINWTLYPDRMGQ